MAKKLKAILLYGGSTSSELKKIKNQMMEENRKFAVIWSITEILYWSFCLVMSTREPAYRLCRHIYVYSFAIASLALLLALFAAQKHPWLIRITAILVDISFLGAGIGIAQLLAPKTIVVFASVLVVPVFFICDTFSTILLLFANIITFAITGRNSMEPETYSWVLTNLCIFSSMGTLLGYFVNRDRFERYLFADSAVKLAELQTRYAYYDPLTGLQNRRAYSEITDRFRQKTPAYCCVIMVDINGLKETNDKFGHQAGDELIIGAAECIRKGFEGIDTIYRIGGDEICVILTDTDTDAEKCLKRTEESCSARKGRIVNSISISYGYADTREFDEIDSILKAADQRMYQFKRNYYINSGKDRRAR